MSLRTLLSIVRTARRSTNPDGTPQKHGFPTKRLAAACGAVLAASVVLAGTNASTAATPRTTVTASGLQGGLGWENGCATCD